MDGTNILGQTPRSYTLTTETNSEREVLWPGAKSAWRQCLSGSALQLWGQIWTPAGEESSPTCGLSFKVCTHIKRQRDNAYACSVLYLAVHKQVPDASSIVLVLQLRVFIRYVPTDPSKLQYMASVQKPGNEKATLNIHRENETAAVRDLAVMIQNTTPDIKQDRLQVEEKEPSKFRFSFFPFPRLSTLLLLADNKYVTLFCPPPLFWKYMHLPQNSQNTHSVSSAKLKLASQRRWHNLIWIVILSTIFPICNNQISWGEDTRMKNEKKKPSSRFLNVISY